MSAFLATVLLIMLGSVLLALPLTPAMAELRRMSDAEPLVVVQQNAGDVRFFADGFRTYLHTIESALRECRTTGRNVALTMPDGDDCRVLGNQDYSAMAAFHTADHICSEIIAAVNDLELPPETTFLKDIYSGGHFKGGKNNQYRAILGDKTVHLAQGSTVMRWVHAVAGVTADSDCKLYGRMSSERSLRLYAGSDFLRVNAPRIEMGQSDGANLSGSKIPNDSFSSLTERQLHDGNLDMAAGEVFTGNLVVRGNLRIGAGAKIYGSVKCGRKLLVEAGAFVAGSLISANDMQIGPGCLIRGPVIAEASVYIAHGTQCGSSDHPTTVSAPRIKAEEGTLVFGTVWAREQGQVVKKV